MFITAQPKAIGVVFDLSLRHLAGRRIIDTTKKQIMEWMRDGLEELEDCFYLYHPEIIEPTRLRGESIASVGNYVTEGWLVNLRIALAQTFWVLAAQDVDAQKYLILITDRIQDVAPIKKLLLLERREKTEMQLVIVGIGQYYHKHILSDLPAIVTHLDNPSELSKFLFSLGEHHGT